MKTRIFILALALLHALSFAMLPENSNLLSTLNNPYAAQEEELIEAWMSDPSAWSNDLSENIESEEEMAIETWMVDVNKNLWNTEDVEEVIQIEEWMYNPSSWVSTY